MKKMVVTSLLVVVLVALPGAFASLETKDFITRGAYEDLVKRGKVVTTSKTIIANPILEEAFAEFSRKLGGEPVCGDSCVFFGCDDEGCTCGPWSLCYRNSLPESYNAVVVSTTDSGSEISFAKKGFTGLPGVPQTKDFITRGAESLVSSGAIQGSTMTKTIVS
uniref:Cyclotide n=1 Tax=Viola tricolor TaxID=214053 RepID=A0A0N9Y173_9ROSI|nr:cyclotide precursor [Viola tricolor]